MYAARMAVETEALRDSSRSPESGELTADLLPQKTPVTPPRLIDAIGLPTPAQARRLIALLGLAGGLPQRAPSAETTAPAPLKHAA